jgi:hypothetical protein
MPVNRAFVPVACLGVALSALALPAGPAAAAPGQTRLVSTNPANFTPNVDNGRVLAVAQVGSTIVLGGTFTWVTQGGTTYASSRLVAFTPTTANVVARFHPTTDGEVDAIAAAADGTSIYVAGAIARTHAHLSCSCLWTTLVSTEGSVAEPSVLTQIVHRLCR